MKDIRLISLEMENFKCFRHLKLDFNGRNTEIRGRNGTGKTSVFDAFIWVLFSKSSNGSGDKNFEVKPLDANGNVIDHNAQTSVEVVLSVNGEETALRRTFYEKWETRRGSSEAVFTGNTSEYYVDGVPCKKFAFQDKVKALVSEELFLMLTSVSYFAKDLPWQKRREMLFHISGVVEDKQIMQTNEMFAPLLEAMGKLQVEDYKAKLLAEKRGLVGARNEIPARINECQKTVEDLQSLDFVHIRAEVEALTRKKESLSGELLAISRNTASDSKKIELQQAQLELDKLEAENRAYRDSQRSKQPDLMSLRSELRRAENRKTNALTRQSVLKDQVQHYENSIENARGRWFSVNNETFTAGSCPTCGQTLPVSQLKASQEAFEAQKQQKLRGIEQEADNYKKALAQAQKALTDNAANVSEADAESVSLKAQIQTAENAADSITDMDGYSEKVATSKNWIAKLQEELYSLSQDAYAAGEQLRGQLAEVNGQLKEQMGLLSNESALAYAKKRIESLRADAAAGAEKLQNIEKYLYLLEQFSRYKTSFVEDSVNRLFRIARFRLFREQANGGVEDRCDVVYDGIPYEENLNTGMKVNVGIDIINALSAAYGIRVPLFVDNTESVTKLETCGSQIIQLRVKDDKELRVNYEN